MSRLADAEVTTGLVTLLPRVLFICTANRCRSPLAEQLMRRALQRLQVDALVASAGFLPGGFATPSVGVRVAATKRDLIWPGTSVCASAHGWLR